MVISAANKYALLPQMFCTCMFIWFPQTISCLIYLWKCVRDYVWVCMVVVGGGGGEEGV